MANWLFTDGELAHRERVRRAGPEELPYTVAWFRRSGKKVYCYGAGGTLLFALNALGGLPGPDRTHVAGVVDSSPALHGREILGYRIEPPDAILRRTQDAVVVISVSTEPAMTAIANWCRENRLDYVVWHDVLTLSAGEKWDTDVENIPAAETAANLWADDISRQTYTTLMRNYAAFSPAEYPARVEGQYFQDFVPRRFYRDFVDLGAFRGDTLAAFRSWMHDDFDSYCAIEALPENFAALQASVPPGEARIRLIHCAVGASAGTVRMRHDPAGASGAAIGEGENSVEVPLATLDDILAGRRVSLIKMDIEGAEPPALRGAEQTLRRCSPALAVSVYHSPGHLWEIPLWIRGVCPAHALFLRHHSDSIGETVCYAVPE